MDLVSNRETGRGSMSRPPAPAGALVGPVERMVVQAMNASEMMFFLGAPLAHVVLYEDRLRASRCEKVVRDVARSCRVLQHAAGQPEANDA